MRRPSNGLMWIGLAAGTGAVIAAAILVTRARRGAASDEGPFDGVDESSADSFPASDAPSHTPMVGATSAALGAS
jgi:hypothetical protein